MLPLKIFWLDMDKFPGGAAKIIDQSEPFLLCVLYVCVCVCVCGGGGGGGLEFGLPVVQEHELLLMITAIKSIRRTICNFNPIRTGGDVFHQARDFLPITLEVIKVHN